MRTAVLITTLCFATSAWSATHLVDDFDTTPDTVNDALGVWYAFSDDNGGFAELAAVDGLGGTPHAMRATGRCGTHDAYIGFGVQLSQDAATDVDLSNFQTLEFDVLSATGGDFKIRIEDSDSTHDSPHAYFSLEPGEERHITIAIDPLEDQSGPGVIDLAQARQIVWVPLSDEATSLFNLTVDNIEFRDTLPRLLEDGGDGDMRNRLMGWWYAFDSGGDFLTLTTDDEIRVVSQGAMPTSTQWAGFVTKLTDPPDNTLDLVSGGGFRVLCFRAQAINGSGAQDYRVRLEPSGENVSFTAGTGGVFRNVNIPFERFGDGFDPSGVSGIAWDIENATGCPFGLIIDDVRFE